MVGILSAVCILLFAYYTAVSRTGLVSHLLRDTATHIVRSVCSDATATDVTLAEVYIHVGEGAAGLRDVTVGIPEGFSTHPAHMADVRIAFQPETLVTGASIRVLTVSVDAPQIIYEVNERGSSVRAVYDSILKYSAESMKPYILIEELVIRRGVIHLVSSSPALVLDPNIPHSIDLPRIHLSDIGAPSGLAFSGIFKHVADPLIVNIIATAEPLLDKHRKAQAARLSADNDLPDQDRDPDPGDPDVGLHNGAVTANATHPSPSTNSSSPTTTP